MPPQIQCKVWQRNNSKGYIRDRGDFKVDWKLPLVFVQFSTPLNPLMRKDM